MEKVECERLNDQGQGIGYINNKIIFVPELLPGDKVLVQITKEKKNFMEGKIIEYLSLSKDRVKPICPYLNCGCALKSLNYQKQIEYKENKVKNILKKFSGLENVVIDIITSKKTNYYRNKITLKVKDKVGYFKNKTNDFLAIEGCALADTRINEIIKVLNTLDLNNTKEITIKAFDDVMIIIDGVLDISALKEYVSSIYMNDKLVYGNKYITTTINNLTFQISKDSFFQVNTSMIETLYNEAIKLVTNKGKALDLFCGTGTISLILSKHFKKVIGVEINKEAVECALENKKLDNINNVEFICGDANEVCKDLTADVVFVDPPRAGLSKEGIQNILKVNPEKIVYISCDPVTLARDLNVLKEKYIVEKVIPVDLFPNTYHVESVSLLIHR